MNSDDPDTANRTRMERGAFLDFGPHILIPCHDGRIARVESP